MGWKWLLFSFKGRINRSKYWSGIGWIFLAGFITAIIDLTITTALGFSFKENKEAVLPLIILMLPVAWMGWAVTAKRLHDCNFTGWWQVLPWIISIIARVVFMTIGLAMLVSVLKVISAIISLAIFINVGFLKGTPGPNKYGQDPLQINTIEGNAI